MQKATLAKLGITILVATGGLGFLAYSSTSQAQHYLMVDELVNGGGGIERWRGHELKVHGWVAPGSIVQVVIDQELRQTFVLEKAGRQIHVFSKGPMPDAFKDGAEIIATGRLVDGSREATAVDAMCAGRADCPVRAGAEAGWVLEATDISAKCASHYGGAQPNPIKLDVGFR